MELRVLYLCLVSLFSIVSGTHFAYGTYKWTCSENTTSPTNSRRRVYDFLVELAFRRTYPWPAVTPQGGGANLNRAPNEQEVVTVGSVVNFYPMGTTGNLAAPYSFNTLLIDQVNYLNDDWFAGTQAFKLAISGSGTYAQYFDWNWRHYYASCCRLSSIRDQNNDTPWTLTGVLNKHTPASPRVTGLPRIWFSLLAPNLYTIPVILPTPGQSVTYRYARVASQGVTESTLNNPNPRQPNPNNAHVTTVTDLSIPEFRLNSLNGDCTWTPQATGLYALGFIIDENCPSWQGVPCHTTNLGSTAPGGETTTQGTSRDPGNTAPNCCSRVPFDFIIQVVPDCNVTIAAQTGCAVPPYFYMPFALSVPPAWRQWNFTRGIQGTYEVCARNDDTTQTLITIDHAIFPPNTNFVLKNEGNPTCYYHSWTPGLTDTDQYVCYYATSFPNGAHSIGQYCILLHILDGNCIQVSGIVRDFHYYHTNFNKSWSDAVANGTQLWVVPQLPNTFKPEFRAPTAGTPLRFVNGAGLQTSPTNLALNQASAWGFYDWYNTDDPLIATGPRNLATARQDLYCQGVNNNQNIFTFLSSAFFPIDNQLFGNEGDDHNYFFTYEVNTYITYLPGEIFNLRSNDDLWVFIDGVLPNGWNLYGIKPNTNEVPPRAQGFSINMDTFVGQHQIDNNETVRCDIFYANRMHRIPYLQIEITPTDLCDALSVSAPLFDYQSFTVAAGPTNPATTLFLDASLTNKAKFVTRTIDGTSRNVIQLTDTTTTSPDSYSAVYYGYPEPTKVKASHGFVSEFSFVVQNRPAQGPDGLSFFLGQKLPTGAGPNLGYGGTSDSFAIELDMSQTAATLDASVPGQGPANYSAVSFHYVVRPAVVGGPAPPFAPNSATERGSDSGFIAGAINDGSKIPFFMQNGTVHNIRIEYEPGATLNSSVQPPGWVRVKGGSTQIVNGVTVTYKQLASITEYQIPAADMNALLQGKCYVGILAGMSAQTGVANIYLLNWNFRYVPTDPKSITYIVHAKNIVAGNSDCVTVQARDACGNLISVGGEANLFTASYTPEFCRKIPVNMTGTDNNDGTYTFCYNPVIKGSYKIDILFQGIAIDNGLVEHFQVTPAAADPANTFATFGELPDCFNTPGYCVGQNLGVFAARFNRFGKLIGNAPGTWGKFFDIQATSGFGTGYDGGLPELKAFVSGTMPNEYIALATAGDFTAAMITNLKGVTLNPASSLVSSFVAGETWSYVGSQTLPLVNGTNCAAGPATRCEQKAGFTSMVSIRGTDSSSASFTRRFTIRAQAAIATCGPYARIMGVYDDIRSPAGQTNIFSVVAMDRFGNLVAGLENQITTSWAPDFTIPAGNRPAGTLDGPNTNSRQGYYQWQFLSYRAGAYQANVYLNSVNINGSYYNVIITPGLANVYTSSGTGPALTTTVAGNNATFILNLADKVNNTINFQNPQDDIKGFVYRLDSTGKVVETLPIALEWTDDPLGACDACVLKATYNATVATTASTSYILNFTMNGDTATYALPNVVPGPLYPPLCTIDISNLPPWNPAGTPLQFSIQAKDRFNNLRTTPNSAGDVFTVVTNVTANNPVTVNYAGSGGIYTALFTPKIEGPLALNVAVAASGTGQVTPQGNYPVGSKTINIVAGPADPDWSYVQNIPGSPAENIAGVFFRYNILSYDQYGNFRDNQPWGQVVAQIGDYVLRSFIPPAVDAVQVMVNTSQPFQVTGNYSISSNATVAGLYTISVQTSLASNKPGDVTGSSNTAGIGKQVTPFQSVKVIPAPTWGPKTVYAGPGTFGGKTGSTVWFVLTAFDLYGNQIDDFHDNSKFTAAGRSWQNPSGNVLYTVTISGLCRETNKNNCKPGGNYSSPTTAMIGNGTTPGTYNVTYVVPTNDIADVAPWTDFNITICHSGGSVTYPYTVPQWCTIIPAKSFLNPTASCAIIDVKNGTAGSLSNFTIRDISCVSPFPAVYATPSFLVTLTRADGAQVTPITTECMDSSCGSSTSTNDKFNTTFTPTVNIGRFRVRVYAYGFLETVQSVAGVFVDIGPGPVYPPTCSVVGFPGKIAAGDPFMFTVALADKWSHPITSGIPTVRANATGPSGQVVMLANGVFTTNYSFTTAALLTKAGDWNVRILEDTSRNLPGIVTFIGGTFLQITVTPGRVHHSFTYATFPANTLPSDPTPRLSFSTAGELGFFTVFPKDQFDNDLPYPDIWLPPAAAPSTQEALTGTDNVGATWVAPNGPSVFTWTPSANPANPSLLVFTVSYNATKIVLPTNNIVISANGNAIQGTKGGTVSNGPFNVVVVPNRISATLSTVDAAPVRVEAGQPLGFTLHARDIWNNQWLEGQANSLNALVQVPSSTGTGAGTTTQAAVTDLLNGGYRFVLGGSETRQASKFDFPTNDYVADYLITLNYQAGASSQLLSGSGGLPIPAYTVIAGPTDPTQTTIEPTPYKLIANTYRNYTVYTVDEFGNRRWLGQGDVVKFIFTQGNVDCTFDMTSPTPAPTFTFPNAQGIPLGYGAYTVNFTATIVGIYTLNITVDPQGGLPVGKENHLSCPQVYKLIQQVIPGPVYPPECWYTISPCAEIPAGGKFDFFLQVRDKFQNPVMRGGTQWAVGVYDAPGVKVPDPLLTAAPLNGASQLDVVSTLPGGWKSNFSAFDWLNPQTVAHDGSLTTTPPKPFITITDFDNSSYVFSVRAYQSGFAGLVISAVDELTGQWIVVPPPTCFEEASTNFSLSPAQSTVNIVPGAPRQIVPEVPDVFTNGDATAAIPTTFTLRAKDYYGNWITTNTHYYSIVIQDISNGNGYTMNVDIGQTVNGATPVTIESAWHGNFSYAITLYPNSSLPGADNSAVSPTIKTVTVQHATCAYGTPSQPYRCPDRDCVASYSQCGASLNGDSCSGTQKWCGGSTCVANGVACPGQCTSPLTSCADGSCVSGTCPAPPACGNTICPDKSCRLSAADCPSPIVCPPGYMSCPDTTSCARNLTECSQLYKQACPSGKFRCPAGPCASSLGECPTPVTCGANMVLCASDGSCQKSRAECPDQYECFAPANIRCGNGACVQSYDQCPPSVTCPPTFVKCPNQRCAPTMTDCKTDFTCPLDRVRCPDGSCQHNLLFCPSLPTCPVSTPTLCWDGTCVAYSSYCSYPQACPTSGVSCPGGACAAKKEQCPTLTRCPSDHAILCSDGSCQVAASDCPVLDLCPLQTPARCPDGQSCRVQISDCPSIVTCQPYQVKCSDGTCAIAADKCAPYAECPDPNVFCAGGECVSDYAFCPTHVTCPAGYAKCTDGSCHATCPTTYQQCPQGQVTCPQASAGTQCAPDLTACPVSFICPWPSTVRCIDSTCAKTAADCPKPPADADYITNKVPCADGTYAPDQLSCPTPVTCPTATPYKCFDGSCRIALTDCPVPEPCPRDALGNPQYKCSNGACSQYPWDTICTSSATPCPQDKPFQCNPTACPNNVIDCCRATAAECDDTSAFPNPITNCTKSPCQICNPGWYYCQSGTCAQAAIDCEPLSCPPELSVMCPDGLCVKDPKFCNSADGCPYDKPNRCPQGGFCTAEDKSQCPKLANDMGIPACDSAYPGYPVRCSDGSCAKVSDDCPSSATGCSVGETKCFDGSCAESCTNPEPSQTSDPVNTCPSSFSFRCPDGFCAKSLSACPFPLVDANCSGAKPFQCAVGTCVVSSTQCPPLYPCADGQVRCPDGTCRADPSLPGNEHVTSCPLYDSCPVGDRCTGTGLGSGLCSTDPAMCNIDVLSGCPSGYTKCQSGQCAPSASSCSVIPPATGCATGLSKCPNGDCVVDANTCLAPDGCPQGRSRCPYDSGCYPGDTCKTQQQAGYYPCADGSWEQNAANCHGLNGCPVLMPFRCANGNCSSISALEGGCPPVATCASYENLCADGSCVSKTTNCQSATPCNSPKKLCSNFKCLDQCPLVNPKFCPTDKNPILCPDGKCAFNLAQCKNSAGGPVNQNCPSPKVRCIDETCVEGAYVCVKNAMLARGFDPTDPANFGKLTSVCQGKTMCGDGSCRSDARDCGIIPRCPLGQYRCPNGACGVATDPKKNPCEDLHLTAPACPGGFTRCEDGTCREIVCQAGNKNCHSLCLEYDGCGLQYPYHCPLNRECAVTSNGCTIAGFGNPSIKASSRRLLQQSTITTPCLPDTPQNEFCMSMVKAALTTITVDTTKSSTVDIALDPRGVARLSLKFSSGSFVLKDGSTITGVGIRPVGESRMRYAVNEIHASRKIQFGGFLPFSTTVLSAAFECEVEKNVDEPFNIPVTVQAYFDRRPGIVNESDICLARLVELPGFTTWRCLVANPNDRNVDGPFYVKKNEKLPVDVVESIFDRCTPPTESDTGVQSTANASAYAFIWSPIPNKPQSPEGRDVIQKNIVWIILGVLLGIAGLVLLTYCAFRLYRYRNKYKEQKEEADRLQEEVENMRQFGGEAGNKDDQVNMTANPLAVQLKDVQAKFNEEDMKLQQAEADLRKQEGDIRQEHLRNMRENRDQLASQLEKLKRQLAETQAAQAPKATYEDDQGGASYATDEPVREEFDGGSGSGAQPKRKGRDL